MTWIVGFGSFFEEGRKAVFDIKKNEECLTTIERAFPQTPNAELLTIASKAYLKQVQEKIEMSYLAIKRKEANIRKNTSEHPDLIQTLF